MMAERTGSAAAGNFKSTPSASRGMLTAMSEPEKKPLTEDEFKRFGEALLQVSKEELAEVVAAEEREKAEQGETRRGRPRKG